MRWPSSRTQDSGSTKHSGSDMNGDTTKQMTFPGLMAPKSWYKMSTGYLNMADDPKICRYCGKVYRSRSGLNDHERKHQNRAPFRCCGKLFYSRTNLVRHRSNAHQAGDKQHACDVCESRFSTKPELTLHKKRVHEERRHKCDTCGLELATLSAFKDHQESHTGTKRHTCQCGKTYRYGSGLSKHKKKMYRQMR